MNAQDRKSRIKEFVLACLPPMDSHRGGNLTLAKEMLAADPWLDSADLRCASLVGNVDVVKAEIGKDASVLSDALPPHHWQPLLYVCFSMFYRDERSLRPRFHEIVKAMIAGGAKADAHFMLGDEKETALYGATGVANDATMGAILLDAGADVNDEDASYHIAEHDTCEAVELFVRRGMDPKFLATSLLHKLDYDDLEGLRTMLDLGIDPNGKGDWGKTPLHQAIMRGRGDEYLDLLIERGANVNVQTDEGRSAYSLAARIGRTDAMELLVKHGAATEMRLVDQFLAACAAEDRTTAQALSIEHPQLIETMSKEDRVAMVEASREGKTEAVRLMIECGIEMATRGACGATALHWAAWTGRSETVKMLIQAGAPLEALCTSYKNSPLGWGVCGSIASRHPEGDYEESVGCLLRAGARIEPYMLSDGTPQIVAKLKAWSEPGR